MKWLLVPLAAAVAFTAAYNVPAPAPEYVPLAVEMAPEVATTPKQDRLPRVVYPVTKAELPAKGVCLKYANGLYLPCATAYQDPTVWYEAGQEV